MVEEMIDYLLRGSCALLDLFFIYSVVFNDLADFTAQHNEIFFSERIACLNRSVNGVNNLLVKYWILIEVNVVLEAEPVDEKSSQLLAFVLASAVASRAEY